MLLILFFIIVLNIVAIALTYYCLSNVEKKEKIIFIAMGIAIIYILTSFVYWISTKDVAIKEVSETGKNLITFLFVPINGIIILPIFAKSYGKYKIGSLELDKLKNRGIVLVMILAILLILEYIYFKDIQNSVIDIIEKNQQQIQEEVNITNILANEQTDEAINTVTNNAILNNAETNNIETNQLVNEIVNQVSE